jgi:ABC-type hemin transport system ATPase subunit
VRSALAALLLAFACFADPSQQGIWVASSQVVTVLHDAGDCAKGSHTKIVMVAGTVCVRETPQQVLKALEDAK